MSQAIHRGVGGGHWDLPEQIVQGNLHLFVNSILFDINMTYNYIQVAVDCVGGCRSKL